MPKNSDSNLTEKKGVSQPETTSKTSAKQIVSNRAKQPTVDQFVEGILEGNIALLSRAITLIESTSSKHLIKANKILERCLPYANNSVRIGITGVPGAGKSTFIEAYGKHLTAKGKKVAVLAVDPSSSLNKGSILGDKTRMESLVTDSNAFIRPSPSGTSLGGVARKTRESIILCEAAGFDTIIIETVGVGQSETTVHSMVDFFLLLKIAGAGDELQGIKRGIIEMADAIVINKSDGDNVKNAKIAKVEFNRALHLYPPKESNWTPKVITASALYHLGIDKVDKMINDYVLHTKSSDYFKNKRKKQNIKWFESTLEAIVLFNFFNNEVINESLAIYKNKVINGEITPFKAAELLFELKK